MPFSCSLSYAKTSVLAPKKLISQALLCNSDIVWTFGEANMFAAGVRNLYFTPNKNTMYMSYYDKVYELLW